jgi:putative membrane protein
MRWAPLAGAAVGVGLSAWLLNSFGLGRILDSIGHAGWFGISIIVAFHGVQVLCSAWGWRAIAGSPTERLPSGTYLVLRWIREAVNNLLPLAQIGGEVIAWRLLRQRGMRLAAAIAGTVADLSIETVTQILFTLSGLILLTQRVGVGGLGDGGTAFVLAGVLGASVIIAALIVCVWLGLGGYIEKGLVRLGALMGWAGAAQLEGLNEALLYCYRAPGRAVLSATWHMISWLLGGVEVWLALHFLGHQLDIEACLVIESLGQAAKALGFAVPGALGVQEGGYVIVGRAFGLPPEVAIAISLLKRLREAVLGIPALIVWQHFETRRRTAPADATSKVVP